MEKISKAGHMKRYGGFGADFAEPLYWMRLMFNDKENVKGTDIVTMDLVLKLVPSAPKYPAEIMKIPYEGLQCEKEATMDIRVDQIVENRPQ